MGVPMKLPWDSAQEIRLEACRFHWHKVYPDRGEDDESYGEEVKSLDFGEEGEEMWGWEGFVVHEMEKGRQTNNN